MKKINNRTKQNEYNTYKNKNEITEAIFYVNQFDIPVSVLKVLEAFRSLGEKGCTQAKNETLYSKAGISKTIFYDTVKPFFETFFDESLIKIFPADRKWSRDGKTKVRSSEYKVLIPLKKIIYLVNKKLKELEQKRKTEREALFYIPELEDGHEDGLEEEIPIPCGSMSEDGFSAEQYKSFKENLSKKEFKELNIQENFIEENHGKIKIKTDIKNYLNTFPLFRDFQSWTKIKRYEIAKTIQLAVIKTKSDIQEGKTQIMVKRAISRLMAEYQNKPQNEFLKLLYTFVSNALKDPQEDDSEPSEDNSEEVVPVKSSRQSIYWEKMKPTLRRLLNEKPKNDLSLEEKQTEIERMLKELRSEDKSDKIEKYRKENLEKIREQNEQGVF